MKIVNPYIEVEKIDGIDIMKKIEKACRTCYRSEGSITEDSYKKLLKNCITRGHESHESIECRYKKRLWRLESHETRRSPTDHREVMTCVDPPTEGR